MPSLLHFAVVNFVRRNRRRTALTIMAVATATLVFCAVMVVPLVIARILDAAQTSPRLVVSNKGSMTYGLPESYSAKIAKIPGVVAVNRFTWFGGVYDDPRHQFPTMALDAANPDQIWPEYGMNGATVKAFHSARNAAIVGIATMHRFDWHVGDTVSLRSEIYPVTLTFRIVGYYDKGPDLSAFMFHRDYLEEALHNPGRVDLIWVRASSFRDAPRVAAAIDEMFRNSPAETRTETEQLFLSDFISRFRPIAKVVEGIGVCAVIAIALAVLNATTMSMRERRRELAILMSLGFVARQIMAAIAAEALAISVLGGAIGVGLAATVLNEVRGFAPALGPLLSFGMPRPLMWAGLAIALFIGMAAAIAPAAVTLRQSIIETMRAAD